MQLLSRTYRTSFSRFAKFATENFLILTAVPLSNAVLSVAVL
jgi:hypothetical protein